MSSLVNLSVLVPRTGDFVIKNPYPMDRNCWLPPRVTPMLMNLDQVEADDYEDEPVYFFNCQFNTSADLEKMVLLKPSDLAVYSADTHLSQCVDSFQEAIIKN